MVTCSVMPSVCRPSVRTVSVGVAAPAGGRRTSAPARRGRRARARGCAAPRRGPRWRRRGVRRGRRAPGRRTACATTGREHHEGGGEEQGDDATEAADPARRGPVRRLECLLGDGTLLTGDAAAQVGRGREAVRVAAATAHLQPVVRGDVDEVGSGCAEGRRGVRGQCGHRWAPSLGRWVHPITHQGAPSGGVRDRGSVSRPCRRAAGPRGRRRRRRGPRRPGRCP